jgi:hypothetical protein
MLVSLSALRYAAVFLSAWFSIGAPFQLLFLSTSEAGLVALTSVGIWNESPMVAIMSFSHFGSSSTNLLSKNSGTALKTQFQPGAFGNEINLPLPTGIFHHNALFHSGNCL